MSAASRLISCAYFARSDVYATDSESSAAANHGTELHAIFAAVLEAKPLPPLDLVSEDERRRFLEALAQSWGGGLICPNEFDEARERIRSGDGFVERPCAVDTRTGRARWLAIDRRGYHAAGLEPLELPGTFDAVSLSYDGRRVLVLELKTGRQDELDTSRENSQIRAQSLAACDLLDREHVDAVIVHWNGETLRAHRHAYDRDELRAWARYALAPRLERAAFRRAVPEPGDGCKWCPAASTCPGLLQSIDPGEPLDAVEGLRRLATAKLACDELDKRLRATADDEGGIRDGDRVWGANVTRRREVDDARARRVLEVLGADVVASCEERKITPKSIEEGLAMLRLDEANAARAELERAGALSVKEVQTYRWTKAVR